MIRSEVEQHIEVHKYPLFVVPVVAFLALVLQKFLPVYVPRAALLELPLLVTLYFGLSRRNPNTGLLLGMGIGLVQDAVSGPPVPIGLYGIAKTIVGFVASSIGARLDVDHPLSRFLLAIVCFHLHQMVFAGIKRLLLAQPAALFDWNVLLASLLNAVVAVLLFPLLDRLRKPS